MSETVEASTATSSVVQEEESKEVDLIQLTKDGGVLKKIIKEGDGERPSKGDAVKVHYRGTLLDGTEFDCSYKRGPLDFKVGTGMVIKGWDLGILSMKVGEKATLTIKSEYGYGSKGSPPKIPGGATLVFDVELVSVGAKDEENGEDDDEDEEELSDEQKLENAKKHKEEGNGFFKSGNLMEALAKYREAVMEIEDIDETEKPEVKEALKLLNLNIATVTKKMEKWPEVVKATSKALEYEKDNVKALFFRGVANRHLKEFTLATEDLKAAIKLNPNDKAMRAEFEALKEDKKKQIQAEKRNLWKSVWWWTLWGEKGSS